MEILVELVHNNKHKVVLAEHRMDQELVVLVHKLVVLVVAHHLVTKVEKVAKHNNRADNLQMILLAVVKADVL